MLVKRSEESAKDLVDDLFGPPPLIKGEDAARYYRLRGAIEHERKPKTFTDWTDVREMTDKLWEQQRYRQNTASLVEAAYVEALAGLLRPFHPTNIMSNEDISIRVWRILRGEDIASAMAREYYSGEANAQQIEELESILRVHGITPEQIRARATDICSGSILAFHRMEANASSSLRTLRKEIAHRKLAENNVSSN
jgi:hypothetical protein